jgi:hypothetical protein
MRLVFKLTVILFISFKCFSQDSLSKSPNVNLFDLYLNCTYDNLTKSEILDSIEVISNMNLNLKNISHCLVVCEYLEHFKYNEFIYSAILTRLKEISTKVYNEGHPIIIKGNALVRIDATELDKESDPYGITNINIGFCCVCGNKEKDKAISVFNDETYRLVNYVFPVKEKRRTFFKRFRKV